jgi:nitronate monooxygenase
MPPFTPFHTQYAWAQSPLIISAPMRLISLAAFAASVTSAGGLGFLGAGNDSSFDLSAELGKTAQLLRETESQRPSSGGTMHKTARFDAANGSGDDVGTGPAYLPIGIGWILSTPSSDPLEGATALLSAHLPAVLKHRPCALWLFAPPTLAILTHWLSRLRALSSSHNYAPHIYLQVSSVAQAVSFSSTIAGPPDVLVVQGNDAGGHGLTKGAGLMTLLPEVIDAVILAHTKGDLAVLQGETSPRLPVFLAAGGVLDGRGTAAALTLGASGGVLGTRFLAAREAVLSEGYRREVLRASDGGQTTVRSRVYDTLRGSSGWPAEYGGRGVINASFEEWESGDIGEEEMKRRYAESVELGDEGWGPKGRMTTYAGTGVGLVKKVQSAKEICEEVREECKIALKMASERL